MHELLVFILFALPGSDAGQFWWYDKPQTLADRPVMVHLFEWKWNDIANECETFLKDYGYGAVQVSPPTEHITLTRDGDMPWYIRYQPVSYKLESRSGTEKEFEDMVKRCNKVGIRIVVDVVLNHMTGSGMKKGENGIGTSGGSDFNSKDGQESFPGVPYAADDFELSRCGIDDGDYGSNQERVRKCRLVGLLDLNQGRDSVRSKMIALLNKLVAMGVAGFRFDASKHMWPGDLQLIEDGIDNLREDIFGPNERPFVVHEVIDLGGEAVKLADYLNLGRYTNFNFGRPVSAAAWKRRNFKDMVWMGPGFEYGNLHDNDVLNFIDNHDNQRTDSSVATYKSPDAYKLAVGFMLGWSYGYPRVMSSYYFDHDYQGPPHLGAETNFATKSATFSGDQTCAQSSGWVCEHRWPEIRRMTLFRKFVEGAAVAGVHTDDHRIAFERLKKGYFALNNGNGEWKLERQTNLAEGTYCDMFSGEMRDHGCTGEKVTVDSKGMAKFTVPQGRIVAIHVGARLEGIPVVDGIPKEWKTTVVLIKKDTKGGENLFLRGGNTYSGKCLSGPNQQDRDPCSIPISIATETPLFFTEFRMWSQNDKYLDFEGPEELQGTHNGRPAVGTPLAYSTNNSNEVQYQPANKYGPGYWMVKFAMDCSKTHMGWFELKGYMTPEGGWEKDIQQKKCSGSAGGGAPFASRNHVARCGYVNVFKFGSNECIVDPVS